MKGDKTEQNKTKGGKERKESKGKQCKVKSLIP